MPIDDETIERAAEAMASAVIRDDEGEFPRLFDLLDFSGENKAWTVARGLARAVAPIIEAALRGQQWQGIESAPKDGTEILAYSEHGCTGTMLVRHIALADFLTDPEGDEYFRQGGSEEAYYDADWHVADFIQGSRLPPDCYPTRWMPLPTPPETDNAD